MIRIVISIVLLASVAHSYPSKPHQTKNNEQKTKYQGRNDIIKEENFKIVPVAIVTEDVKEPIRTIPRTQRQYGRPSGGSNRRPGGGRPSPHQSQGNYFGGGGGGPGGGSGGYPGSFGSPQGGGSYFGGGGGAPQGAPQQGSHYQLTVGGPGPQYDPSNSPFGDPSSSFPSHSSGGGGYPQSSQGESSSGHYGQESPGSFGPPSGFYGNGPSSHRGSPYSRQQ